MTDEFHGDPIHWHSNVPMPEPSKKLQKAQWWELMPEEARREFLYGSMRFGGLGWQHRFATASGAARKAAEALIAERRKSAELTAENEVWICPECGSLDIHEVTYQDDFSSHGCWSCNYQGSPGEEFPTANRLRVQRDAAWMRIAELEREVEILRQYGKKDCTTMADERLAEIRANGGSLDA